MQQQQQQQPEEEHDLQKVPDQQEAEIQQHEEVATPEPTRRPINNRSQPSMMSAISTDDEEYHDDRMLDDGIPSEIPLEALAGPALILPSTQVLDDGRTFTEEFDWAGREDDDDEMDKKDEDNKRKGGALATTGVIICLSKNSSAIAYACIALFTVILLAIDVAVFVVYQRRDQVSITSYGLQLWFTWIAFMWCIGFMSQIFVELVPWAIKKAVGILRPQSTEVLRMRLSVSVLKHEISLQA